MIAGSTKTNTATEGSDLEGATDPSSGSALNRISTWISSESLLLLVLVGSLRYTP
jgi:hypothetical protein